jgi:hypothetical protein
VSPGFVDVLGIRSEEGPYHLVRIEEKDGGQSEDGKHFCILTD